MLTLVIGVLLLTLWLIREFGSARRYRIATHHYHLHKKSRGRIQSLRRGATRAIPR